MAKELFKKSENVKKGEAIKKAFVWDEDKWKRLTLDEFRSINIGQLIDGTVRIVINFDYAKTSFFVVTCDEDMEGAKKKYPDAKVIHLMQIISIFNGWLKPESALSMLSNVFIFLKYNTNTKVVDVKPSITV